MERFIKEHNLLRLMRIPQFLSPTELSDKVLAERYRRHPGPYQIGQGWQNDLEKIFPGITSINYDPAKVGAVEYGELGPSETELLFRIVSYIQPKTLVEFGTAYGRGTRIMAGETPADARVLTVDLPDEVRQTIETPYSTDLAFVRMKEHEIGQKYKNSSTSNKIKQVRMDATSKEFSMTLDDFLGEDKIDFALIDAAHDYRTTKKLFQLSVPRMSHGGVIMTDDYNKLSTHVGVTEFFSGKARKYGFVFYWFNPMPPPYPDFREQRQSGIFFINLPEAKNRKWKEIKV